MNLTNDVWDNFPLATTNTGTNWFQGEYIATCNKKSVACSGTKLVGLHHTSGVVLGVLMRMILTYGLIMKGYQLNQMVVLL